MKSSFEIGKKYGFKKGHIPWNKGLVVENECLYCKKIFEVWRARHADGRGKYCSMKCYNLSKRGKKQSLITRAKRSESLMGEKNHRWKGGISIINHRLKESFEYKDWRTQVFRRDYWTCQICGYKGKNVQADHKVPWSVCVERRFDKSNGLTLCKDCHKLKTFVIDIKFQTIQGRSS